MPRRIIIIRHGETKYNRLRKWQGWTDVPLNKQGRLQASNLIKRIKKEGIDELFTSDLIRAKQTAEILSKKLGIKPVVTRKLRERSLGIFEGMDVVKSQEKFGELLEEFFSENDKSAHLHKGESLIKLKSRLKRFLNFLFSSYTNKTVALVTHGGVKYHLLDMLTNETIEKAMFENASITTLRKISKGKYKIISLSDTDHLK